MKSIIARSTRSSNPPGVTQRLGWTMRGIVRSLYCLLIASALTGAALPAMAAQCQALQRVMSLDINDLPGGQPSIEVLIGDTPDIFLVDTAGAVSSVTKATVLKYKLTPSRSRRFLTGLMDPGLTFGVSDQEVRLPSITIGNLRQANPRFMVWPPIDALNQRREFAGSLGPDFLGAFDLDFDFAAGKLNLMSPDHCPGQGVYWQAPPVAAIPMRIDSSAHVWFPVILDGKPIDAMLDTGLPTSTLSVIDAQVLFNVNVDTPDTDQADDAAATPLLDSSGRQFDTLSVGSVTIANPRFVLLPDVVTISGGHEGPAVMLGMTILRRMHLYVAYRERKLYVSAANFAASLGPQ